MEIIARRHEADTEMQIKREGPYGVSVVASDGFQYTISHDNLVVEYKYRTRVKQRGARLPYLDIQEMRLYSSILNDLKEAAVALGKAVIGLGQHRIRRFGVMAIARLDVGSVPPGVDELMTHLKFPWSDLRKCDVSLLDTLSKSEGSSDQCHHFVKFDMIEEPDDLEFTLDWQRVFKPASDVTAQRIEKISNECIALALDYFERFAISFPINNR
jgi:hypothetical protein